MQKGSGFTMWQLNTQCNEIGNSYVFLTREGQVVVMDGGCSKDEYYLRGFLGVNPMGFKPMTFRTGI